MHETVDHGGGDHGVSEHFAPTTERLVGGHDDTGPLVARRDQLEEEIGCLGIEGDVADLVDDDQWVAARGE